jgi:hypothetical protein
MGPSDVLLGPFTCFSQALGTGVLDGTQGSLNHRPITLLLVGVFHLMKVAS